MCRGTPCLKETGALFLRLRSFVRAQAHLFHALKKTRLIPEDADAASIRYSRCGRTDKGVSAAGQVGCCEGGCTGLHCLRTRLELQQQGRE